ncbi:hypothetical protein FSP39_010086 [Pinctada imbricata]|uniref:SWIM-type domain-containing protein n=1 Tax=Pinctada imbricata TaxID=66713 RepID=A0AA89CDW5_PINIB|nr:hypothetical protein FSP39_010086 [Pinctada imbricata]
MDTFQELIQSNVSSPVCLVYDTTFNLGDFYVSPLVFRHVLFEQGPLIPLAFLIHERKQQKCHNRLFEFIADKISILKSKDIPFITDREPALANSVLKFFPNFTVLHCWNHIRRDFKEELRKQGANPAEMSLYLNNWKTLSQCEDEDQFHSTYDEFTSKWTTSVKQYFDKHIKNDILQYSGRWIIEKFSNLYDPYSGVTNNPSESINSVLKRMTGWQELPVDTMMLSLFYLQNFYFSEIQRGRAGVGNHKLKSKYREARLEKEDLNIPNKVVLPEKIIEYVKTASKDDVITVKSGKETTLSNHDSSCKSPNKINGLEKQELEDQDDQPLVVEPPLTPANKTLEFQSLDLSNCSDQSDQSPPPRPANSKNMTQKAMARLVLDSNGVTHVPECNAFVVTGSNNQKYCVTLNPETCQCPSVSTCYHIIAVKLFVGLAVDDKKTEVSLRTLSKRSLKRSDKKSGRKRPRINDIDPDVIPAPDSLINTPQPTKMQTPKSKKKLRFALQDKKSPSVLPELSLPAKKRITLRATEDEKRWVGRLTVKHKSLILDKNGDLCSDIMDAVQCMLHRQFPDVNGMHSTSHAPVWMDDENRWRNEKPFPETMLPAAQVHHNGKNHWVTSVKSETGQVYLFDSLSNGDLSPSLEIQLAALYGLGKTKFPVKLPAIQQQTNSHDCGLHAIANLVEFCFGRFIGKRNIMYNTQYLRDHLVYCLERQLIVPFPKIQTKVKTNKKKLKSVIIQCNCRCARPNCMEEMVGCDWPDNECQVWRHRSCANQADADADWLCTPHRQ